MEYILTKFIEFKAKFIELCRSNSLVFTIVEWHNFDQVMLKLVRFVEN